MEKATLEEAQVLMTLAPGQRNQGEWTWNQISAQRAVSHI